MREWFRKPAPINNGTFWSILALAVVVLVSLFAPNLPTGSARVVEESFSSEELNCPSFPVGTEIGEFQWYNSNKGYGFIQVWGYKDIFFQEKDLGSVALDVLVEGQDVAVRIVRGNDGRETAKVIGLVESNCVLPVLEQLRDRSKDG